MKYFRIRSATRICKIFDYNAAKRYVGKNLTDKNYTCMVQQVSETQIDKALISRQVFFIMLVKSKKK